MNPSSEAAAPLGTVEVLTELSAFHALRDEWETLYAASGAPVFLSWCWLYPWLELAGPMRELRIFLLRDAERRLLAALPLGLERVQAEGKQVRRLSFVGEYMGGQYMEGLALPHCAAPAMRALMVHVRDAHAAEWDVLDLNAMATATPTSVALWETFQGEGHACLAHVTHQGVLTRIPKGQTFDQFLEGFARRGWYQRQRRWYEKQEGFHIERVREPARIAEAMDAFNALYRLRWTDIPQDHPIVVFSSKFIPAALSLFAERGQVSIDFLRLGEQRLAASVTLFDLNKARAFGMSVARDPKWHSKSPGFILDGQNLQDAFDAGFGEFHRGFHASVYKLEWGDTLRECQDVWAFPRTPEGLRLPVSQLLGPRFGAWVKD